MKKGIHPELKLIDVKCACGAEHKIWSTVETMRIDVCSNCHPFYKGGKGMQFVDSEGRIDRFRRKYGDNY